MAGIEDTIERAEKFTEYYGTRKKRATERLSNTPEGYTHFAIVGLNADSDYYGIPDIGFIRKVEEPPDIVELSSAINQQDLARVLSRYSPRIRYELSIRKNLGENERFHIDIAHSLVSLIKIKTLTEILVPAAADYSWSTISSLDDGSCVVFLVEDIPIPTLGRETIKINASDVLWATGHLKSFFDLYYGGGTFRIASEALCTHHHAPNLRLILAHLWAGVESLFDIDQELRFRLACYIPTILEERGIARHSLFKEVLKSYDVRCKAVHGADIPDKKLHEHIQFVKRILSLLLCKSLELGRVLKKAEIEKLVFE